jgi:hypothetical protein
MKKSEHYIDVINGVSYYKIFFEFNVKEDLTTEEYLELLDLFDKLILDKIDSRDITKNPH